MRRVLAKVAVAGVAGMVAAEAAGIEGAKAGAGRDEAAVVVDAGAATDISLGVFRFF